MKANAGLCPIILTRAISNSFEKSAPKKIPDDIEITEVIKYSHAITRAILPLFIPRML